jgi:hypothetical protein
MATSKTPKPRRFFVNSLTGSCELRVTGSVAGGRLEKKVKAILDAIPADAFVRPLKATWKLYFDCDARTDGYEIRFAVRNATAVEKTLFAL